MRKTRDQIYDEVLVLRCQQGDREALDELVGRWQKRLWLYAYRVTGSESAAWDIVQEAWFSIVKGLSRLKDSAVFPNWAFKITNNKCSDWLRKQQKRSRLNGQLAEHVQSQPDQTNNDDEEEEFLRAAVTRLSTDRRALLDLRYREGFDLSRIAEILGIPEGTVKSRLHRTVNELRTIMERD
ncbi:MAG: RNA polymerase sigma factor [Sedimentisphaerales bacterium]|nr:RNA polymerase sigma factor [Sedimentisphaerales bacterium]